MGQHGVQGPIRSLTFLHGKMLGSRDMRLGKRMGQMVEVRMPFEELILFPLDKGPPLKALK